MTKAQLKEKYNQWNHNISELHFKQDEVFKQLQDLCATDGDGHRYCSVNMNVQQIMRNGGESSRYKAMELVSKYYQYEGQWEALKDLAIATENFKI